MKQVKNFLDKTLRIASRSADRVKENMSEDNHLKAESEMLRLRERHDELYRQSDGKKRIDEMRASMKRK